MKNSFSEKKATKEDRAKYKFYRHAVNAYQTRCKYPHTMEVAMAATLSDIYKIVKRDKKELLFINDRILNRKEFIILMNEYLKRIKELVISGKPVNLPGGVGAIGVYIEKRIGNYEGRQTERNLIKVLVQKRHIDKLASPLIDTNRMEIKLRRSYHINPVILKNYYADKTFYCQTGENMMSYAKNVSISPRELKKLINM